MRSLVFVGIVLIILGVLGLAASGITWQKDEKKADLGPIEVHVAEKKELPIHPVVGGIVAAAGVIVLVAGLTGGRGRQRSQAL